MYTPLSNMLCLILLAMPVVLVAMPTLSRSRRQTGVIEMQIKTDSHQQWTQASNNIEAEATATSDAYGGILECPTAIFTGNDLPLYKRSSCPWYYVVEKDLKRFPTVILKAVPLCSTCIGSNGSLECNAITKQVDTMVQTGYNSTTATFTYTHQLVTVNVGYTCAGKRTVASGSGSSTGGVEEDIFA